MKMVDMKRSKQERKNEPTKLDDPEYHYGLRVHLDHEALEKLGMDKLPKVGSKISLHAHAHVKSAEEREHEDGGKKRKHRSVELELRHMALEHGMEDDRETRTAKGGKKAIDKALEEMDRDGGSENEGDGENS